MRDERVRRCEMGGLMGEKTGEGGGRGEERESRADGDGGGRMGTRRGGWVRGRVSGVRVDEVVSIREEGGG